MKIFSFELIILLSYPNPINNPRFAIDFNKDIMDAGILLPRM